MNWEIAYAERLEHLGAQSQLWFGIAALGTVLLILVSLRVKRSQAAGFRQAAGQIAGRLRAFRASDSATASIEYLLVLFPFLVIILTVWQLAFMFNAQLHVGYAAYAAARSASVLIPAELTNEPAGELKRSGDVSDGKWSQIRRAAIPGTLAISPGDAPTALAVGGLAIGKGFLPGNPGGAPRARVPDPRILAAIPLWVLHYGVDVLGNLTRLQRASVKAGYADGFTEVLVNGTDDRRSQTLLDDTIEVRVNYVFWLHVPYVGGLMEALFDNRPTDPRTGRPLILSPYPSMTMSERIVMTNWRQHCAIAKYCP